MNNEAMQAIWECKWIILFIVFMAGLAFGAEKFLGNEEDEQ